MTSMGFSLGVWNILLHQSAPRSCTHLPPGYDKRIYAGSSWGSCGSRFLVLRGVSAVMARTNSHLERPGPSVVPWR